jgi:hypothetical protein
MKNSRVNQQSSSGQSKSGESPYHLRRVLLELAEPHLRQGLGRDDDTDDRRGILEVVSAPLFPLRRTGHERKEYSRIMDMLFCKITPPKLPLIKKESYEFVEGPEINYATSYVARSGRD